MFRFASAILLGLFLSSNAFAQSSAQFSTASGPRFGVTLSLQDYMTPAQITTAQSGVNTTDITSAITAWLAACPSNGCNLIVPPGYYYSSTCNFTIANAFTLQGSGNRSLDGTKFVSVIACGANSVPLFTANSLIGLFHDVALISVGFTPAAGSSAIVVTNGASNNSQKVDYENIQVDGFYDSIDVGVGNSWHMNGGTVIQNSVHWGVRVRNTVNPDAGDWHIDGAKIFPAANAAAAIRWESSGGGIIHNVSIVPNSGHIVDGISIDTTGQTSGQILITGSKIEGTTGIPINIVHGWGDVTITGNILRATSAASAQPAIYCSTCSNMTITGNVMDGTGNAITIASSQVVIIGCNALNFQSGLVQSGSTNVVYSTACTNAAQSYAGPGDVKSGAKAWWGLRAYSLAAAGAQAAQICNASDANCVIINTLSNGTLDIATMLAAPLSCGGAGGTCTVKTLYDQSGANSCTAAACDIVQNTIAARPVITFNCVGNLVCVTTSSATAVMATTANSSIAQPFTIVGAAKRTGSLTSYNTIISNAAGTVGLYYSPTANNADLLIGTDHNFAATSNAWHALIGVGNGASSSGSTDGSTTAISATTTALTSASLMRVFNDGADPMIGTTLEIGVWGAAFTGTEITNVTANMRAFWGF